MLLARKAMLHFRSVRLSGPVCAVLLCLAVLRPGLAAQDPVVDETVLSENVELPRLLDLCAVRLGLNIQYDPTKLAGAVTVRLGAGVSNEELWTLTNRLLAARGFTSVQMPGEGTLTVVRLEQAAGLARMEADDLAGAQAGFVKVVRRLEHKGAQEIQASLGEFLSKPGGVVQPFGQVQGVVISDLRSHVDQALAVIDTLDAPGEALAIEALPLTQSDARQLANFLTQAAATRASIDGRALVGKPFASSDGQRLFLVAPEGERAFWIDLVERFDRGEAPEARIYAPKRFPVAEVGRLVESVVGSGRTGGRSTERFQMVVDELTNTLIITTTASRHRRVDELMARLEEAPVEEAAIDEIPAQNVDPEPLAALVEQVAATRTAVTGRALRGKVLALPRSVLLVAPVDEREFWLDLIERLDQREEVQTLSYAPRHFPLAEVASLIGEIVQESGRGTDDRWKVVTDELTGTLIITATPSKHEEIHAFIERLDASAPSNSRPVRAFAIHNRSATDLVELVERLMGTGALALENGDGESTPAEDRQTSRRGFGPTGETAPDSTEPQGTGARAGVATVDAEEQDISLTADEATNTLIATGEARFLEQLEELIQTLDVRQPQVMIEVLAVAINDSDALDLGVELRRLTTAGDSLIGLSSLFGIGAGDLDPPLPVGVGFTGAVLNPGEFSLLVSALQSLNRGRTLTIPKVLVNTNEQAVLNSVVQEPFSAISAFDTVATTSFGGTQDAGTSITVRPQVAEGDHLVLEYDVGISSFVGDSSDPNLPPPRQQNNVSSVVTIPDGHTVALGGLETEVEGEAVTQVPLLGQLPWIGELFKNRSITKSRSRFFVFIRADVLRHDNFEDLRYLTEKSLRSYDVPDSWPEVEPRVID